MSGVSLAGVQSLTSTLTTSLNQYIVSPLAAFGVGGFVFGIEGEDTVNLTAEITDHYTESNTTFQDHIAIKPKKFTLKSYTGEQESLINAPSLLATVAQKLTTLSGLLPALSQTETQIAGLSTIPLTAQGLSNNTAAITNAGANIYALVKNSILPQTKQAQAYAYFKALFQNKTLVSVQSPYEFMTSMAIESVIARQGEESKNITQFTIILKEIRIASTQVQAAKSQQGRNQAQSQPVSQGGNVAGINPASSAFSAGATGSGALPMLTGSNQIASLSQFGI